VLPLDRPKGSRLPPLLQGKAPLLQGKAPRLQGKAPLPSGQTAFLEEVVRRIRDAACAIAVMR